MSEVFYKTHSDYYLLGLRVKEELGFEQERWLIAMRVKLIQNTFKRFWCAVQKRLNIVPDCLVKIISFLNPVNIFSDGDIEDATMKAPGEIEFSLRDLVFVCVRKFVGRTKFNANSF